MMEKKKGSGRLLPVPPPVPAPVVFGSDPQILSDVADQLTFGTYSPEIRVAADSLRGAAGTITYLRKECRRLQDRLNRVAKLAPGRGRVAELERISEETEIEADVRDDADRPHDEIDGLLADSLFLARLAHDLGALRDTIRGNPRKSEEMSRYNPANWPRGPRP